MQEEVNEKTISLCIKGGKITAQILKAALIKLLTEMDKKKQRGKGEKGQCKKIGKQSMDILSAGQCAAGNSSAFVPDETIAGDRSTSNADRWICDFYDSAGGRQCGGIFGTGSSNDSASMVHIRRGET